VVVARSFARIHFQNLVSYGVLPLVFDQPEVLDELGQGETLAIDGLHDQLAARSAVELTIGDRTVATRHELSARQLEILRAGGIVNRTKASRS